MSSESSCPFDGESDKVSAIREEYRRVLGKTEGMRRGFTSGTCALAASKAALLLLTGEFSSEDEEETVEVVLKKNIRLVLPVFKLELKNGQASASIIKDSGDDDDVCHAKEFSASLRWSDKPGIEINGGRGVGKATRPGLPVKPGEWAVNPGPRKMINDNLSPLIPDGKGLEIVLSVPEGEELARQTWNPRIGIEGGISIIGTSGVIEPRSAAAYKASIALVAKSRKALGENNLYITPGYVGDGFYQRKISLVEDEILRFGDHAGFALNQGPSKGFEHVHLAAHIGKMAKIAAGLFNTHCKTGDARLETVAALAGAAGADREQIRTILEMKMAEEAVSFLQNAGLEEAFELMALRTEQRIKALWQKDYDTLPELHLYILDLEGNLLGTNFSGGNK